MAWWIWVALGWLAGAAAQTGQAVLWAPWGYALGVLACGGMAALAWFSDPKRWLWHERARTALAVLAVGGLAWTSTGWRAASRMAEQIPPAWHGQTVPVTVQVEGLPRAAQGDAVFDARVLDWWPDRSAEAGASTRSALCVTSDEPAGHGSPMAGQRAGKGADGAAPCRPPSILSVRMRPPDGNLPRAGQRWRLHVRLHAPDGPANPGAHDPTLAYFERGVRAMARVPARAPPPLLLSATPSRPWQGWIDRWRQDIRDRIFAIVPASGPAGVLAGLSVGDQSAIEREDWEVFRKAGLGHVVSISGTHIAMLGWLAAWLMRRLWARWPAGMHRWAAPDVALWAGVAFSAFYALLAGWGVPAQRTVWMMFIVALMRASGRRWPWPLVWLGSAVILTALDPWCLRQPGFWLSYVAVGVLMSAGMSGEGLAPRKADENALSDHHATAANDDAPASGAVATRSGWRTSLVSGVRQRLLPPARRGLLLGAPMALEALRAMGQAQWLVTRALLPLTLVCFGQVSLIGFGANLIAIPLFTLAITPLALMGMLWAPCWTFGAWLIEELMALLAGMAAWPFATLELPEQPFWLGAAAVLAGWSLALPMHRNWRLLALPVALMLVYLPQGLRVLPPPKAGQFQLLSVDIGQGTAVLVRTQRHTLLFDTGARTGPENNAGDRVLVPLMRTLGIGALDTLLISHEDNDHVGGAEAVVRQVPVARLRSSLDPAHPLRVTPGTDGQPLAHTACEAGQSWQWDGVHFEVLHPTAADLARRDEAHGRIPPNDLSCVLHVRAQADAHGDAASALLTGDIGKVQEGDILARAGKAHSRLRSTLLLAPHHGSKTSSSERFLRAVQPQLVVIQAGRRNAYGHPAPEVIARYGALGLAWVATPDCGAHVWDSAEAGKGGDGAMAARAAGAPLMQGLPTVGTCWRHAHHRYWQGTHPLQQAGPGHEQ